MLTAIVKKNVGSSPCLEKISISCNFTNGWREINVNLVFNLFKE